MKALILVGGFGTRLRPLTLTRPKSLIEFANKPIMFHQLEALSEAGVKTVILATSHLSSHITREIEVFKKILNMEILFTVEDTPLGTAGPMALSKGILDDGTDSPFFMLNSDVICNFPLKDLAKFHKSHGKEATILTTTVSDPSRFGVICVDNSSNRVKCFIEKPKSRISNTINTGIYVLNPSILKRVGPRPTSIEKEIFPELVRESELCAFKLDGFWADIGEPTGFISGTSLYLEHLRVHGKAGEELAREDNEEGITGNVMIHPTATIGARCKLGPNVVIGRSVIIGEGVRISNSVIMSNSVVEDNAHIESSIIGNSCQVGKWARVYNASVIGDYVRILDESIASSVFALPNTYICGNINVGTSVSGYVL